MFINIKDVRALSRKYALLNIILLYSFKYTEIVFLLSSLLFCRL